MRARPRPVRWRHGRAEGLHVRAVGQADWSARMAPERVKAVAVVALAVVSVTLTAIGPKILGHATDLIFSGLIGGKLPAGLHQGARPSRSCAARATTRSRRWSPRWTSIPARASTSPPSATCCCSCSRCTSRRPLLSWLQGYLLNDVVQSTVFRMRSDVEDKVNRLPLSYFDRQPRGELLSRVTNDIDNISQTLQQTMSQLMTSLLTVVAVLAIHVLDLAAAGARGADLGAAVDAGDQAGDGALAGDVHRPVASYRPAQRAHRGDLLRARAGQGLRPAAGGRGGLRRGRTRSSTRPASAPSSSAA